jgi:hypothetical protein
MRPFVALEKLMRLIKGTGSSREVHLPPGYSLDRSDPDVLVLRSPDRAAVAPLQYPGRHGGGHRTGGEDALQGAKPDRLS